MASFTDLPPQFTPYTPQLPVEAMVKVGMQKQALYDQGVQKIQAQIDQVAGMDVAKDVHKNYLQSKLNELSGNLKTFAASDFSNYQLVNSIAGMTKQIAKDPTIQNAVSSTQVLRKGQKDMEAAKKAGKSDVANEDLFLTQSSNWLSDGDLNSSFSGQYVPYTDVFKKLQEIAKSVGEDSTIVQQLFQTDSNGNPVLINGKLQYNDVMAETLLKGKDKNKILNAFQSGLDANDYRQLSITGRYRLKGKEYNELANTLEDGFLEYQKSALLKKDLIQDKIVELKTKGAPQENITSLEEMVVNIDNDISKRRESTNEMKSADADAIRGSIYTNNFLDSMSGAFSTKETYTKYLKNPGVEVMMDREKAKLEANKFELDKDKFRYQQKHDTDQMNLTRWTELFKAGLVDENGNPTGAGLYSGAARDLPLSDQTNSLYFSEQFEKGMKADMDAQSGLYERVAIADWMAKNSGKINPNTGKIFTEDEMKGEMAKWAKKVGMSYNDYIVLQGQKATDRFNSTKGKSLGAEYSDDFKTINQLSNKIGVSKKMMDNEKAFISKYATDFTPFDLSKVNVQPIEVDVDLSTGGKYLEKRKVRLTKEDLYNLALLSDEVMGSGVTVPFASAISKDNANKAVEALAKKFGENNVSKIMSAVNVSSQKKLENITGNPLLDLFMPNKVVDQSTKPLNPLINLVKDDNFGKTMALREQYYKSISQVGAPKGVILYKDKPEAEKHLSSSLASIASDYAGIDSDYQEIASLATDPKSQFQVNIDPAVSKYDNNSYSLQVTKPDGSLVTKPITEQHYQFLTGKAAPSLFVNSVESTILSSPYNSTNLAHMYTDDDAYSTAFVKDYETKTKNYNVAIDYVKGSGGYFPKLYVQTSDDSWKLFPYNVPLSAQGAKNFPSQVDDVFIKSLMQSK
jgi:hypothetical protein